MSPVGPSGEPPQSPLAREALESIIEASTPNEGIERERAVAVLGEAGFEQPDAVDLLDQLHDRGYLYAVDDELFVTDRDILE